jgi:integrase
MFSAGKLMIRQALGKDGRIGTPKGGKPATIDLLPQLRKALIEKHIAAGRPPSGPVFANSLGGHRQPRRAARFTKRAIGAGLSNEPRAFRFHDLRHSCVFLLVNAGASPTWVQEFARHPNLATTLGYAHKIETPEAVELATSALGNL